MAQGFFMVFLLKHYCSLKKKKGKKKHSRVDRAAKSEGELAEVDIKQESYYVHYSKKAKLCVF